MTREKAIAIALAELRREGARLGQGLIAAVRMERHMSLGKDRSGWVVFVPLDVPPSFEPNEIHVEVYDPDGQVHIPTIL